MAGIDKGNRRNIRKLTFYKVLLSAMFNAGYRDYKAGLGFHKGYETAPTMQQEMYELGRLYAAGGGNPPKSGRMVEKRAIQDLKEIYRSDAVPS